MVAGICDTSWSEAKPAHNILDCVEESPLLTHWVCIIIPQETLPIMMFCKAEIDGNCFGMTEMKKTVRLRRKSGFDFFYWSLVIDLGKKADSEKAFRVNFSLGVCRWGPNHGKSMLMFLMLS